ncbi:MAG TPA: hypothetical protein VMG58_15940 [Candidatus Sulfotelmatobacter sp.]|nr:hypothetical protein [Candidatus Sulfotelmatobacter sp.]
MKERKHSSVAIALASILSGAVGAGLMLVLAGDPGSRGREPRGPRVDTGPVRLGQAEEAEEAMQRTLEGSCF